MSTTLQTAINDIIGRPTDSGQGLRWCSNWSTGATPGAGVPNALTIARKLEADPVLFLDDMGTDYPAVFFQILGMFPAIQVRGQHYECTFRIRAYIIDKLGNGERPYEQGRVHAVQLTENIMGVHKIGLTYIDAISWDGCDYENDLVKYLHLNLQDYFCGATRFSIHASGLTF